MPYRVVVAENPCAHCQRGEQFAVVGPDGVELGRTFDDEADADEYAAHLNAAYIEGQQASATDAVARIGAERARQLSEWSPAHDDGHADGSLAGAAAMLALEHTDGEFLWVNYDQHWLATFHDKHVLTPRVRQLVIAGALIAAEIDRLERADGR